MASVARHAGEMEHQGDIVGRIQKRQEIVGLEDEADLFQAHAAQIAPQPAVVVDHLAVEPHPSLVRIDDGADDVEQRALAGTRGSDKADHLAR